MAGVVKSATQVCNLACLRVGVPPINDFEIADTTQGEVLQQWYEVTVHEILRERVWRFATTTVILEARSTAPFTRFSTAYIRPSDVVRINYPYRKGSEHIPLHFDLYEGEIHCASSSDDVVYLEYVRRVHEQYWPAQFALAVTTRLAALLSGAPMLERVRLTDLLNEESARAALVGSSVESQSRTTQHLRHGEFLTYAGRQRPAYNRYRRGGSGFY